MQKPNVLALLLAIVGTVLACFPIVAPVLLSAIALLQSGVFRFDYLMPAELFPFALAGGGLLLWASLRARTRVKLIASSLAGAVLLLIGSQVLAVITGLASGETEPAGVWWALVLIGLAAYALLLVLIDIAGVLLVREVSSYTVH